MQQFLLIKPQLRGKIRRQAALQLLSRHLTNIYAVEPFKFRIGQCRRGRVNVRHVEALHRLLAREDLALRVKVPTDVGQEIEHRLGQIAGFDELVHEG